MLTLSPEMRSKLKSQLLDDEGYRRFAYTDSRGYLTIGIGRNIQSVGISMDEALFLLDDDILRCEHDLWKCCPVYSGLCDARKMVLLNMCLNLGIEKLMQFRKMMDALGDKNFNLAASEMLSSAWHFQVGMRAERLASIMERGEV